MADFASDATRTRKAFNTDIKEVCETFGIEKFHKEQQKAIDLFFDGKNVFDSLPSDYGKFQWSHRIFGRNRIFAGFPGSAANYFSSWGHHDNNTLMWRKRGTLNLRAHCLHQRLCSSWFAPKIARNTFNLFQKHNIHFKRYIDLQITRKNKYLRGLWTGVQTHFRGKYNLST